MRGEVREDEWGARIFKSQIRDQDTGLVLEQVTATQFCQWFQVLDMPRLSLPGVPIHEVGMHNLKRGSFCGKCPDNL